MVEPQKENLETAIRPGTQLKMKRSQSREEEINQDQALVENLFNPALLLSYYPVLTEEEELLL
jgi:hypothetical protein